MSIKTKAALKAQNTAVILENVNEEITATVMHNHLEDIIDSMRDVSAFNLGDLSDVSVSTATNGQVLSYSGGTWRASTISTGTTTTPLVTSGYHYSVQMKSGTTLKGDNGFRFDFDRGNIMLNNTTDTSTALANFISGSHAISNTAPSTVNLSNNFFQGQNNTIQVQHTSLLQLNATFGNYNDMFANSAGTYDVQLNFMQGRYNQLTGSRYCVMFGNDNSITNMENTAIIGSNIDLDSSTDTGGQLYVNAITATDNLDDDYTRWFQLGRDGSVGSWRFTNSGSSLVLQVWDGAAWTTKDTWTV